MASGSSGPNNVNDIAQNSSLTVTASEFIPGSATHSLCSRSNAASNGPPYPNHQYAASTSLAPGGRVRTNNRSYQGNDQSASVKNIRSSRRQDNSALPSESGLSKGSNNGSKVNGSVRMQSGNFRSSPRSSYDRPFGDKKGSHTKFSSGSHAHHQNRGWNGELSEGPEDTLSKEGAFGGAAASEQRCGNQHNMGRTYYTKEYRSGFSNNRDRNGNRNPGDNQVHHQPRNKSRLHNDVSRDQTYERPLRRESGHYGRDYDRGRESGRFWDRKAGFDREADSHSESGLPQRYYSQHGETSEDFFASRQNKQHRDNYSEKYRDDRNHDRESSDGYDREHVRGYTRNRGSRLNMDVNRNDQSQKRMFYHRERGQNSSFNTRETFGAEALKSSSVHDSNFNNHKSSCSSSGLKQFNHKEGDDVSQRERLTEQLNRGTLECLVCCDRVRQTDSIWSCTNCYHVLHLRCVMKWAKSSKADLGWRCPACQNVTESLPSKYQCFCGKISDPQWNRQDTPHTCGEVCGKSRETHRPLCTHHCTLLCHPGPCPPCVVQVTRNCGCGKTSHNVKCGSEKPLLCESVCAKPRNCGAHVCSKVCHLGPCDPCSLKIEQTCFCAKHRREVECTVENQGVLEFCCTEICSRSLECGNHTCDEICHPGECKPCDLTPDAVTHCPCGQTKLSGEPEYARKSCKDPIPTCDKICQRKLHCGQPSNPHTCKTKCHVGPCPSCPLSTMVRCRCGHMDRDIPCDQLTTKADDARCEKKCTKKRSCAKHKCNQQCCIEVDHPCPLPCNHTLSCGLHRCEQLCHRGRCQPCWRTSFEELYCECGAEVLYPPVPCGTKPPPCSRPCSRQHDCDHAALHPCHNEPNCPPCSVLTQKYCYGKHELRKSIPCHQKEFSCGLPCNKELPCGRHKCIQACHKGECLRSGAICSQHCANSRTNCQHPCSVPCHDGPCPDIPCKETVRVTCECGHRSAMRPCAENAREYQRIATSLLASKMADVQLGHSIDIGDIMGNPSTRKLYLKSLECNDECKIIERNRRMAIGLQIRNPDLSSKLTPRYSDFMRGWAKKDPGFCQMVHDKLTELVKLAKESKQKCRSYSFEVMNREKRQFVHEYCEHFGCESVAYDQEPKRNVVATAQRTKAWLPSIGLLELVQRESGQRKVPGPMLNSSKKLSLRVMDSPPNKWASKPLASSSNLTTQSASQIIPSTSNQAVDENAERATSDPPYIDYFNS